MAKKKSAALPWTSLVKELEARKKAPRKTPARRAPARKATVRRNPPPGFRTGFSGGLACPHRDLSCCPACAAKYPEIVDVVGEHFWIGDPVERAELVKELRASDAKAPFSAHRQKQLETMRADERKQAQQSGKPMISVELSKTDIGNLGKAPLSVIEQALAREYPHASIDVKKSGWMETRVYVDNWPTTEYEDREETLREIAGVVDFAIHNA